MNDVKSAMDAMDVRKYTVVEGREGYGGTDVASMDEWDAMPDYDPAEDRMPATA